MCCRLMDADGSGAIGSDELSSAFKVVTCHTLTCDSTIFHLLLCQSLMLC